MSETTDDSDTDPIIPVTRAPSDNDDDDPVLTRTRSA
jgi:hypothetical protein